MAQFPQHHRYKNWMRLEQLNVFIQAKN